MQLVKTAIFYNGIIGNISHILKL